MLTYKYVARNPATGEKIKAEVQADSEQAAAKLIHREGYAPIDISLKEGNAGGFLSRRRAKVKTKEKIIFARQLSTLVNAGLPLVQSLRSIAEQTSSKPLAAVVNQIIAEVEGGSSLSQSLARRPDVFNNLFVSLVAAGETSGTLDISLERIANQQEKDAELLSKVRGALAYPVIVLLVMVGVVGFMVIKVLPQVQDIYKDLPNVSLPLVTKVLLAFSQFSVKYWWIFALLLAFGGVFSTRWIRTIGGKKFIDRLKMRLWPIGPLYMKMYMARFARTGATLISSGVPLIQMLDVTSDAINNVHIAESIHRVAEKVKGGKALSDSIGNDPNFLRLVPDMLRVGEKSGSIEKMLLKTADYYEKEVDNQIKTISTVIEPVLMIILGLVAFIVVAAILLPIYGLVGKDVIR